MIMRYIEFDILIDLDLHMAQGYDSYHQDTNPCTTPHWEELI